METRKYFYTEHFAEENTVIASVLVQDELKKLGVEKSFAVKDAWINLGGWQSWNPGFEISPSEKMPHLSCFGVKQWSAYLQFPNKEYKQTKYNRRKFLLAQFITYFRWNDFYFFIASTGNIENVLPPVQFVINRKTAEVKIELCDVGKNCASGELACELTFFTAESYFEAKEKLREIFSKSTQFEEIKFLGDTISGWESWYNHYANINEKIILEDLTSLCETENLIKISRLDKNLPAVFQIDDGWEKTVGDWTIQEARFPNGLKPITEKIAERGLIQGLWIAPFIVDYRSPIAQAHPDWILRDKNGAPIPAGMNPNWGGKRGDKMQPSSSGTFYAFDLSRPEVVAHIDSVIETAINEWGFRYLKLDFLYAGMLSGNHAAGGASYEHYAKALAQITSRKFTRDGKSVAYLGCGVPFEPSFKNLPLSRIGCDTLEHWDNPLFKKLHWNGRTAAYLNVKDTLGHAMWDKTIFANDPDVIFIRNENCSLTRDEKILIATVAILF